MLTAASELNLDLISHLSELALVMQSLWMIVISVCEFARGVARIRKDTLQDLADFGECSG